MSKKKSKARDRREREATAALQAAFPRAFPTDDSQIKPLAISTRDDVTEWLDTAKPGVCRRSTIAAVQHHCGRVTYKKTLLVPGAMRINLQGNPVEPVTPEAAEHARTYIERAKIEREQAERNRAEAQAKHTEEQAQLQAIKAAKPPKVAKTKTPKQAKPAAPQPVIATPKPAVAVVVKKKRRVILPPQ